MDICCLIKDGMANQEISSHLFISSRTVINHVKSTHKKLKVNTHAKLMALFDQKKLG